MACRLEDNSIAAVRINGVFIGGIFTQGSFFVEFAFTPEVIPYGESETPPVDYVPFVFADTFSTPPSGVSIIDAELFVYDWQWDSESETAFYSVGIRGNSVVLTPQNVLVSGDTSPWSIEIP